MKRVLVLCEAVGREGGTEEYLARVLPELARSEMDVLVTARRITDPSAFGISPQQIAWSAENEPPSLSAAARVREMIERTSPDVVLTSNVFDTAVLAAARRAKRFIVRLHDHRAFCPNGDRYYPQFHGNCTVQMGAACLANALLHGCIAGPHRETVDRLQSRSRVRDAMLAADAFIVSSEFMALISTHNGVARDRIVVAAPPIESSNYDEPATLEMPERRVLFAGRIIPQKGLVSLVRAIGYIPEKDRPVLVIAGAPSPELDRALVAAAERSIDVDVLGNLSQHELRGAIDASRAVMVPSLWAEPFGLVGIEAQARGRPSVAYAVGGIPEWVGDAGITVSAGDERALARAVERVISDEHWRSYASAAMRRAPNFHPSHHVRILKGVLCA